MLSVLTDSFFSFTRALLNFSYNFRIFKGFSYFRSYFRMHFHYFYIVLFFCWSNFSILCRFVFVAIIFGQNFMISQSFVWFPLLLYIKLVPPREKLSQSHPYLHSIHLKLTQPISTHHLEYSESDSESSSSEQKNRSGLDGYYKMNRKSQTHKRMRKKRTAIPVQPPKVPSFGTFVSPPEIPPLMYQKMKAEATKKLSTLEKGLSPGIIYAFELCKFYWALIYCPDRNKNFWQFNHFR